MIKNKKKSIIILIIIIIFVLLNVNIKADSDIPNVGIDQYKQNIESTKEINANELTQKIKNKDSFILYIGYSECVYCRAKSIILKEFIDQNKVNVNYLDLNKIKKEDLSNDLNNFMANQVQFEGTPTVLFVDKGLVNQDLNYVG